MVAFSTRLCRAAAALHCAATLSAMRPQLAERYARALCGRAAEGTAANQPRVEAHSLLEVEPADEDALNETAAEPLEQGLVATEALPAEAEPLEQGLVATEALPAEDEVITANPVFPDAAAPQLYQTFELKNFPNLLGKAERDMLNGKYVEHPTARMNRQPIFVGGKGNHFFLYWCSKEEDWRIGIFVDWGDELACNCLAFAHTERHAELLNPDVRTQFPGLQDGAKWHQITGLVPHVSDKTEQTTPPDLSELQLPGSKEPFQPEVLDQSTSAACGAAEEVTNFAPAFGAFAAPQVNVNLNVGLHFGKKHKTSAAVPASDA